MKTPSRQQQFVTTRMRRGFSFTEVLFAVMVLGIGFIMVAAIFPVAIQQTQATGEETVAATVAKGGVNCIQQYASQLNFKIGATPNGDGIVHPIGPLLAMPASGSATNNTLWPLISGNMILLGDPRYAWVAMYRQTMDATLASNYAQVIVIATQVRNHTTYGSSDVSSNNGTAAPTLQARQLNAVFTAKSGSDPDLMTFSDIGGNSYLGVVTENAFVVISNDGQPTGATTNGYVYRLGVARPDKGANTYELAPGNDTTGGNPIPPTTTMQVLVVGAGYTDPANPGAGYSGPAQDVAVYSTFVTLGS